MSLPDQSLHRSLRNDANPGPTNHGLLIGRYSPNSDIICDNMILKWYPPKKKRTGSQSRVDMSNKSGYGSRPIVSGDEHP